VRVLAHTRVGDGPRALVLLHGFLGSARNLGTLARGLVQRTGRAVVALDLPGHGESPPLPPRADLAALAHDVLDTARALGLHTPWTLIGHSLGGRVALRAGELEPAMLGHLGVLDVSPSPRAPGGETAAVVQALAAVPASAPSRDAFSKSLAAAGLPRAAVDWLLLNLAHEDGVYRWRIDRASLAALYPRIGEDDLWPAVEGARPYSIHVVRGGASDHVSDGDVRRLQAAGARVDTLQGVGHFLHVERPAELMDRIVQGLG
jgi:pimeloyl-ACP methyl ester carboxylesterase